MIDGIRFSEVKPLWISIWKTKDKGEILSNRSEKFPSILWALLVFGLENGRLFC